MTTGSSSPSSAEWVAILDGAACLCIVVGVMAALALILTPEVWPTFVPLAVGGTFGGAVLVRWTRSPARLPGAPEKAAK